MAKATFAEKRRSSCQLLNLLPVLLLLESTIFATQVFGANNVREKIRQFSQPELRYLDGSDKQLKDISSLFAASLEDGGTQEDYVIAHPRRVDVDGRFVSHDVKHFARDPSQQDTRSRRKRDAEEDVLDHHIYFTVPVEGNELTLNVSENRNLVHSNYIVERLRDGKDDLPLHQTGPHHRSSLQRGTNWPCHFRGHVIGHPNSVVAISTCNGLTGLIRLQGGDYFIEPLTKNLENSGERQPHKVYRRDVSASLGDSITSSLRSGRRDGAPADQATSQHQRKSHKGRKLRHNNANRVIKLEKPQDSQNGTESLKKREFCGVVDTRSQYRRDLRAREAWEARRARSSARSWSARRRRRSLSLEHWIEMMVVVDRKMVEYYELYHRGEVERYVLTIVNMVSELFHDESIGNALHVTLIRLIILEGDENGLKVTSHAEKTLDSFCRWAKRMNPRSDHHANHHDVAVMLTRRNICSNSNTSCETLGLAHVAGMCQAHRSCNVNQDTGLSLAFTVAHELGHNFAMHHDGQLNNCDSDEKYPRVMAPHLTSNSLPMRWSPCSRRYVTRFLDRNWGFCLMDVPSGDHDQFDFPSDLPGVLYDADHQCRLMFGPKSRHCNGIDDICNRLWCVYQGSCRSRLHAAVPGTKCGRGRWCYAGSCVRVGKRPSAVDGSWGSWSKWSRCSRTCGVGVSYSARYCDQPSPKHGGRYCLGERRRYRTCNVWSCPPKNETVSFRTEQCSEFNNMLYRNQTFSWLPVDSPVYPCELHCYTRDSETPFADRLRDKVVDGTKCFSQGNDICVDGICKRLGCDLRIDSVSKEDRCGVCMGDGSSCSEVDQTFDLELGDEYVQVGLLPRGARNIVVAEAEPSGNFLALRSAVDENNFYLNGNYMIQWDSQLDLAGTVFTYQRINKTLDNITADGPITHDIAVMLLFVGKNPGVHISYVMPHNVTAVFEEKKPEFEWMMQPWSPCSRTCGKGIQMSLAICVERKAGIVEEDFCDIDTRPSDKRRICSNPRCPPEWLTGPWQPCSVTCGGGVGRQRRSVLCIRSVNDGEQVVLNKSRCQNSIEPEKMRPCSPDNHAPCPVWKAGPWGNCSEPCGSGQRNRSVQCVTYIINDVITVDDDVGSIDDDYNELPVVDENDVSYQDVRTFGPPAKVTLNKVTIVKRRKQKNLLENFDFDIEDDEECDASTRPDHTESCNVQACPAIRPRSSIFAENSLHGSGSIVHDPLMSVQTHRLSDDFDENFDVSNDLIPPFDNNTWNNVVGGRQDDYNDILDLITPHPSVSETNESANVSTSNNQQNSLNASQEEIISTTVGPVVVSTLRPKWLTGVWGQCSTSCGVGARIRNVMCSAGDGNCDVDTKPAPAQRCNLKPCANWQYAGWTKCSRQCGHGRKRRKVQCRDSRTNAYLRPYHCNSLPKLPRVNATCMVRTCLPWKTSRWNRCNVTCGLGTQRRRVACSQAGMCDPAMKPVNQKNCMLRVCVEWRSSHWGRCPVNCGYSLKKRSVECVERDTGLPSDSCNMSLKPDVTKKCNRGPCRVTDFDFSSCAGDRLKPKFCKVLKNWGKCVQPSLAIQCCQTCKTFGSVRRKNKIS